MANTQEYIDFLSEILFYYIISLLSQNDYKTLVDFFSIVFMLDP